MIVIRLRKYGRLSTLPLSFTAIYCTSERIIRLNEVPVDY